MLKWAGAILGVALAYLCVLRWTDWVFCPVRRLTGLYCPGCGVSRMCLRLARLDFAGAFRANPLLLVTAPVMVGLLGVHVGRYVKTGQKTTPRWENRVWWALAALLVVYGIARNLPWFSWLAPR